MAGTSNSAAVNLTVEVVTSRYAFNSIVERVALLLAADQRYQVWFKAGVARWSETEILAILDRSTEILDLCRKAWSRHVAIYEGGRTPEVEDFGDLIGTFDTARAQYEGMMSGS